MKGDREIKAPACIFRPADPPLSRSLSLSFRLLTLSLSLSPPPLSLHPFPLSLIATAVCRFWRFSTSLLLWKPGRNRVFLQRGGESNGRRGRGDREPGRRSSNSRGRGSSFRRRRSTGAPELFYPQTGSVPAALRSLRHVTAAVTVRGVFCHKQMYGCGTARASHLRVYCALACFTFD